MNRECEKEGKRRTGGRRQEGGTRNIRTRKVEEGVGVAALTDNPSPPPPRGYQIVEGQLEAM